MASTPPSDDRIVISEEDLDDGGAHTPASPPPLVTPAAASPPPPDAPAPLPSPAPGPQLVTSPASAPSQAGSQKEPSFSTPQPGASGSSGQSLVRLTNHPVISSILAGVLGGILGGILFDIVNNNWLPTSSSNPSVQNFAGAIIVIPAGLAIGLVIASWDDLVSKSPKAALRRGLRGAAYGAVGIYVGQVCGTYLFLKILGSNGPGQDPASPSYFLARIVSLAVLGACVGLALGAVNGLQLKRIINGLIGGAIGGAVGGFVFQLLVNLFQGNVSQNLLDVILFVCLAIGVALGTRIVERVRRDSWIRITAGPMSGKEFVLYKPETRIGADYRCDIVVAKDTGVQPFHAAFLRANDGNVTVAPFEGSTIRLNGLPSEGGPLKNLDAVIIGGSILTYQERMASK